MSNRPAGGVSYDNSGRVVLVTGGAQGIGHAICDAFAKAVRELSALTYIAQRVCQPRFTSSRPIRLAKPIASQWWSGPLANLVAWMSWSTMPRYNLPHRIGPCMNWTRPWRSACYVSTLWATRTWLNMPFK